MTRMMRLVVVGVVVSGLLCPLEAAAKKKKKGHKPTACPGGRYLVQGDPLIAGAMGTDAVVLAGSNVSIASGCDDVKAKVKATKKGTIVAAHWKSCSGITGPAVLKAKLKAGSCTALAGAFKAKKAKIKRRFTAAVQAAPAFATGAFSDAPLTQNTVGPAGGTIAVTDPSSPLNGLAIV